VASDDFEKFLVAHTSTLRFLNLTNTSHLGQAWELAEWGGATVQMEGVEIDDWPDVPGSRHHAPVRSGMGV
jgi:hypothetical protein